VRRERLRTTDGDWIEALVPETPADVEALRRRQEQGEEIDDRLSFGDDRPRRQRRRRPRHRHRST
jgi:hypothetical protein